MNCKSYKPTFYSQQNIDNIKCEWKKIYILWKNKVIWSFWCQQHISKKLGEGHFYHCVSIPCSLTFKGTALKCLRTKETNCWSSGRQLYLISVWYSIPAARQSWVFFFVSFISWFAKCFQIVKGQFSTRTFPLWSRAVVAAQEHILL